MVREKTSASKPGHQHRTLTKPHFRPTKVFIEGQIAQLVEQWTENPCVAGSIPALSTFLSGTGFLPLSDACLRGGRATS